MTTSTQPFSGSPPSMNVVLPTTNTSCEDGTSRVELIKHDDHDQKEKKYDEDVYRVFFGERQLNTRQVRRGMFGIKRRRFSDNSVHTTKYTWWNFIVLNLFHQLKHLSNLYFLLALIFAFIPGVSPTTPITQLQIIFIILVNMLREGGEDILRYLNDRKVNRKITKLLMENGQVMPIHTSKVRVGDIVRVECDETIPADMILLGSCHCEEIEGNVSLSSNCKIETANLDGETNLKTRFGILNETVPISSNQTKENVIINTLLQIKGSVECEHPSENLHSFKASALLKHSQQNESAENLIPINQQHLLLKGTILKATEYAYGLVIYCGKDTKMMRNMQKGRVKFTSVNFTMNIMIGILFVVMCCLCIAFAGVSSYFEFTLAKISTYTGKSTLNVSDAASVVLSMMTFFILFNSLIPISLFVTLEFVRMFQAWLVNRDNEMSVYDADPHDPVSRRTLISASSLSSELLPDLATVDIIFSDKTGTLTNNEMIFNKVCFGTNFIHDDKINNGQLGTLMQQSLKETDQAQSNEKKELLEEDDLFQSLNTMLLLSLCHNVDVRASDDSLSASIELMENVELARPYYEGASVDEVALVNGAFNNDFKLKFYSEKKTIVSIFGTDYTFERLCEIPFTPERKRMSTIFKIPKEFLQAFPIFKKKAGMESEDSPLVVCFTKGADSFLFPYIEESQSNLVVKGKIEKQILEFAKDGLRTLLLAYKFIPNQNIVDEFVIKYNELKSKQQVEQELLDALENEMERNLQISGATGIEDSLQEKVPDTVKFFLDAGLQLWMLTGDKTETAINIAGMSNFIDKQTRLIYISGEEFKPEQCKEILQIKQKEIGEEKNCAIVIDGLALSYCVENNEKQDLFFEIVKKCKTVICCRATPKQKSLLVGVAQRKLKKKGLAIGDGANDVPMIQKAKIGVGIIGKEGSQAKLNSDFAIPRFHMLRKLLAVHGRYSFKRCAKHIFYSFYKNISVTCLQIYFTFYTMYSGQTLVDANNLSWWNLFFTLLNTFVYGWFDKDIRESKLLDEKLGPRLYASLKKENIFNLYMFARWIGAGIIHSLIIFMVVIYGTEGCIFGNGHDSDSLWLKSVLTTSCMICVVHFKCYLEMEDFTIINHVCMIISFVIFYGYNILLTAYPKTIGVVMTDTYLFGAWDSGIRSAIFWFVHIFGIVVPLSLDVAGHGFKVLFWPDEYQKVKLMKTPKAKV